MDPEIAQFGLDLFGVDLKSQWEGAMSSLYPQADASLLPSPTVAGPVDMRISQHAIVSLKSQLGEMDSLAVSLQRIQEELAKLQGRCSSERLKAEQALLNHQSIVAPIRRVPDDVLVEIFLTCMGINSRRFQPQPITLASVCRRWRTLAHSTARLWSTVIALLTPTNYLSTGSLLNHYTSLSAALPLQISLKLNEDAIDPALDTILNPSGTEGNIFLSQTLAASAPRWKTLAVTPSILPVLHRAWLSVQSSGWDVSMLEILEIDARMDENWPLNGGVMSMFSIASRLRYVICHDSSYEPYIPLELPWNQIEQLDGLSMNLETFSKYLRRCPKVARCGSFSFGDSFDGLGDTCHRALRAIDAYTDSRTCLEELFTHFQFPSLVELRLEAWYGPSIWPQHHFSNFCARSSCMLQRLVLGCGIVAKEDLLLIFPSVPSILELHFSEPKTTYMEAEAGFDTDVIEKLSLIPHSLSNLLPHLRTLSLLGGLRFDTRTFTRMIMSRTVHTHDHLPIFQNLYVQIEEQHSMEKAGRTLLTYEPALKVEDFKDVQDILGEHAFISVAQYPTPDLVFPQLL
ncbi:hypothetical protein HWV62_17822 [Athelia sp. TMB]|nr:hypothetical protein HWV62_17822 [Athelia sp. TMB]